MTKKGRVVQLSLAERLRESPRQATSMSLPLAVHHRLDQLAYLAEDAGATRSEIIGMLVAEAELDAEKLELAILRYRKLKVEDVIPSPTAEVGPSWDAESNVVQITQRSPGRPGRRQRD